MFLKDVSSFTTFFFDLDGLLVDTELTHYKAFMETLRSYDKNIDLDVVSYENLISQGGQHLKDFILSQNRNLNSFWTTLYEEKNKKYIELITKGVFDLMPGAEALLSKLKEKRIPCFVVTNSTSFMVDIIKVKKPVLKIISYWITREHYNCSKPAPDGYIYAYNKYCKPKEKAIGFEDTFKGIKALQGSPIFPVFINSKKKIDRKVCQFSSLEEIVSLL